MNIRPLASIASLFTGIFSSKENTLSTLIQRATPNLVELDSFLKPNPLDKGYLDHICLIDSAEKLFPKIDVLQQTELDDSDFPEFILNSMIALEFDNPRMLHYYLTQISNSSQYTREQVSDAFMNVGQALTTAIKKNSADAVNVFLEQMFKEAADHFIDEKSCEMLKNTLMNVRSFTSVPNAADLQTIKKIFSSDEVPPKQKINILMHPLLDTALKILTLLLAVNLAREEVGRARNRRQAQIDHHQQLNDQAQALATRFEQEMLARKKQDELEFLEKRVGNCDWAFLPKETDLKTVRTEFRKGERLICPITHLEIGFRERKTTIKPVVVIDNYSNMHLYSNAGISQLHNTDEANRTIFADHSRNKAGTIAFDDLNKRVFQLTEFQYDRLKALCIERAASST